MKFLFNVIQSIVIVAFMNLVMGVNWDLLHWLGFWFMMIFNDITNSIIKELEK
jgi:hypothetical protein